MYLLRLQGPSGRVFDSSDDGFPDGLAILLYDATIDLHIIRCSEYMITAGKPNCYDQDGNIA
jgi:hypothetical protein